MVVERNVVLPVGTLFIIAAVFCVMIRTDGISNSVVCSNEMQIQPSWRKRILFSGWKKGKKERICISIMVTSKRNIEVSSFQKKYIYKLPHHSTKKMPPH